MSQATSTGSLSSLLESVGQIEPVLREHAADAERERHLSDAVVDALRACGMNRLFRPRALGGLEADPITAFRVIEEISRIDSAAGWNLQLTSAIDAFGAWFPDDGAKEIFGQPDITFAGAFFPPRRAVPVAGGYRVTGQTPFASGAHQAKWFEGLAHIHDDDTPRLAADGTPVTLLTMCPASDAAIVDTWRTLGMRGTGSHDVIMTDVFVPSRHTALLVPLEKPGSAYQGPLCKLTAWAAIDDLLELAGRKTPSYLATPLRDRSTVQAVIGKAEATLGAGRAYLYEALWEVWDKALQGHRIDMPGKMKLQLAATHAAAAAKAVDLVHAAAGTSAIRDEHRFQRHFRDVHTITQHAYISASRYESGGQYIAGVCLWRSATSTAVLTDRAT
jgi:indole-3-acetate monooxygenase